jgi:hypothetical protein
MLEIDKIRPKIMLPKAVSETIIELEKRLSKWCAKCDFIYCDNCDVLKRLYKVVERTD